MLPSIIAGIHQRRFAWVGGGRYLTSTCYVDNAVDALLLAAEKGRGGEAYFASDGEPVVFREFVSELLEAHGVKPPHLSVPSWLPALLAAAGERLWRWLSLSGPPPSPLSRSIRCAARSPSTTGRRGESWAIAER